MVYLFCSADESHKGSMPRQMDQLTDRPTD